MSDLLDQLRNENWLWTVPGALRLEAADEIERLRTVNAELVAALDDLLPYAQACIGLPESLWPHDSAILKARAVIAKAKG